MPLPDVDPADSSDTRWALQTAQTLWGSGEQREALQWVRRAAEAAAESGQDDRALALAKAGAELRAHLEIPRTMPPPPPAAKISDIPPPSLRGESELVVTLVSPAGESPSPDASLVGHRAVRVAVIGNSGPNVLTVRVLQPGEVAPDGATVALLVALASGTSPLPSS